MENKALKPGQLVVEFRSRLGIAVGQINGSDQNSPYSGLDVAGLVVLRISGQTGAGKHRSVMSREDSYPIPGALTLPDRFVPKSLKSICGKGPLLRLQFLKANHVWLSLCQPG